MSSTKEPTRLTAVEVRTTLTVLLEVSEDPFLQLTESDIFFGLKTAVIPHWKDIQAELPRGMDCLRIEVDSCELSIEPVM